MYSYFDLINTKSYFYSSLLLDSTLGLQAILTYGLGLNPVSETKISLVVTIATYSYLGNHVIHSGICGDDNKEKT